jgi:hypothetical protein
LVSEILLKHLSEEELKRFNNVRSRLVKVLEDFNKRSDRFVARLKPELCPSDVCAGRTIFFEVFVEPKQKADGRYVLISFKYELISDRKAFTYILPRMTLSFEDVQTILSLTQKLAEAFYQP